MFETHESSTFLKFPWQQATLRPGRDSLSSISAHASRCKDCGVPVCQGSHGCVLSGDIPEWNSLARRGQWQEAFELLHAANNFPEFTGSLCSAPCESACVLSINDSPVPIRKIESAIVDMGFRLGWAKPQLPSLQRFPKIAVVGSGPAGLAAAQQLVRSGYRVEVFERAERAGGLLRSAISEEKLPKSFIDRRVTQLKDEGVHFRLGVEVGRDFPVESLTRLYHAICLTVGSNAGITGATSSLLKELGVSRKSDGGVAVDDHLMTTAEGVFAAGDAHRGASSVVWAMAEGRKMAASVDEFLKYGLKR